MTIITQKKQGKTPQKGSQLKTTKDNLYRQSEDTGDASRENFNLRTEHSKAVIGRSPREPPDLIQDTTLRNRKQVRRFAEHVAKSMDEQTPEYNSNVLPTQESAFIPTVTQADEFQKTELSANYQTTKGSVSEESNIAKDSTNIIPIKQNADVPLKTEPVLSENQSQPSTVLFSEGNMTARHEMTTDNQKGFGKLQEDKSDKMQSTTTLSEELLHDSKHNHEPPKVQKDLSGKLQNQNLHKLSSSKEQGNDRLQFVKKRNNDKGQSLKERGHDRFSTLRESNDNSFLTLRESNDNNFSALRESSDDSLLTAKDIENDVFSDLQKSDVDESKVVKDIGNNSTEVKHNRGFAYRKHFDILQTDKKEINRITTETPVKARQDMEWKPEHSLSFEQDKTQESQPDSRLSEKNSSLSHEHKQHSVMKRPAKLHFDNDSSVTKEPPKRKPISPDAAKYLPPNLVLQKDIDTLETDANGSTVIEDKPVTNMLIESTTELHMAESIEVASGLCETQSIEPISNLYDTQTVESVTETQENRETLPDSSKHSTEHDIERQGTKTPSRLQFSKDETTPTSDVNQSDKPIPNRKLEKARRKADESADKLEKAHKNIPKKRKIAVKKSFDEKKGKVKKKLYFEEETKSQHEHIKGPLITRPMKTGANAAIGYAHTKIFQAEHENVGTQAAHKAEIIAEGGLRSLYRHHKTAAYRRIEKLERKTSELNVKVSYRQLLNDNPKLNSNVISRMAQKRKIKKQYAQEARKARHAEKTIRKTAVTTEKVVAKAVAVVKSNPSIFGIIAMLSLIIILISSVFTSCSNMVSSIGSSILATSYLAENADIDNAELYYTEWETELQIQISRTESDYPDYDEYRYQVGDISHNPYELMAYLTAVYHDFNYNDIETSLRQIFNEQYQLTFIPSIEIRYYEDEDGEQIPYDWHVMTVTLTSRSFTEVISSNMDSGQLQHYDLLMQSKGSRQYVGSPFDFNWIPYVTSYYGYRIHPTNGTKDYHKGIDVGVPVGTDILAGHNGMVTFSGYSGDYGYVVVIEDGNGLVTKYAHCDLLLVSAGQSVAKGEIIAKSGNTGNSTGPHLHFEVIKDGQYLNPLYFVYTNDDGLPPVYGEAGAAMGDGSYAALIEEAERYLGYPYVWGGSNPSTSFDCSGYISWILNQSGVASVGRQTAQGLYNLSNPVSPTDAQPGDLIFFTGTYSSTNPVTHVGLYVGGGMMIHCGDPIQYTSINTSYWQNHFYAFARIH